MALFRKSKEISSNIQTLSAGNSTLGILPDIHEWPELPSRVVIKRAVTLNEIQQVLHEGMINNNIPVVFTNGRIEHRETFSKRYEDCIIISHKNPPESYFDFVFTCRVTNDSTFVRIYRSGFSYYNYKINEYNSSKKETDGVMIALNFLQYAFDKPDLQAWEDGYYIESQYYTQVIATIKEVLCS